MIFVFLLGLILLAIMAFEAHSLAYFPGDIAISHVVQASSSNWQDRAVDAVSWLGHPPQSNVVFGAIVLVLFACGARRAPPPLAPPPPRPARPSLFLQPS